MLLPVGCGAMWSLNGLHFMIALGDAFFSCALTLRRHERAGPLPLQKVDTQNSEVCSLPPFLKVFSPPNNLPPY